MPGTEQLVMHYAINPVPWSKPKEVVKPSFGKGIDITPVQSVPTPVAVVSAAKSSKRKRPGNQNQLAVVNSSVPPKGSQTSSPSLDMIVAPKKSLIFSSLSNSTVVTKQIGDELVSQDTKMEKALGGFAGTLLEIQQAVQEGKAQAALDRQDAKLHRDQSNKLFTRLFERMNKIEGKEEEE
jgi:hypothetical protein